MKNTERLLGFVVTAVFILLLCGCTAAHTDTDGYGCMELEPLTFEEIVGQHSNTLVTAVFKDKIDAGSCVEYVFRVKECIFGNVTYQTIYVQSAKYTMTIQEPYYTYDAANIPYEIGREYLLLLTREQSIFYEHDRYTQCADLMMREKRGEYTHNGVEIAVPEGMTMREYIVSLRASSSHPLAECENIPEIEYASKEEEIAAVSETVAVIRIDSLETESDYNCCMYQCSAVEILSGRIANRYEDGSFYLLLAKDTVEVGGSYIVGFHCIDNGYLYKQAGRGTVMEDTEENRAAVCEAIAVSGDGSH